MEDIFSNISNSTLLKIFAQANRQCGHIEQANSLENAAAVYEAQEVLKESDKEKLA